MPSFSGLLVRLSRRADGRALVAVRGLLVRLNRSPPLRRAGALLCRALVESTVARLRRHPDIANVLVRGSYGRGHPEPFLSDLDLVVVAREPEGRPTLRVAQSVHAALAAAARTNPLLRDPWQLVLGESDLGLVARYAESFQTQTWSGDGALSCAAVTASQRLSAIASWNRQHLWTIDGIRCAFSPTAPTPRSLLAFTAAERKATQHWARKDDGSVERRALPGSERELVERCSELVRRLGESAAALAPPPRPAWSERAEPHAIGAFMTALESARIAPATLAAYQFEAGIALVHREGAELAALCALLPALARATGRRIVLYSPAAAAIAPLFGLRELWREPSAAGLPDEPAFLGEQFAYEALFGGTELRLRAASGSSAEGRRQCTIRLIRWLTFLRTGRLLRGEAEALAAAPPAPFDMDAWFTAASGLWRELRELLETTSPPSPA